MRRPFCYRPLPLRKAAVTYDRVYPLATSRAVTLSVYDIDREAPIWLDVSLEVPRERYLPPNAGNLAAPKLRSLFSAVSVPQALDGLAIKDMRVRRRVKLLLEITNEDREFSHAEVDAYGGHVTNRNSRLLRSLFIELPYFPSRTLGEVKMYRFDELVRKELDRLLRTVEPDWEAGNR
jgi:hypothetical protein